MLGGAGDGEHVDGQLRAEVACEPDAASVFGAIGLKVGVGVDDALCTLGNDAQQPEGPDARTRRTEHLGGQLARLFEQQRPHLTGVKHAVQHKERLDGDEEYTIPTLTRLFEAALGILGGLALPQTIEVAVHVVLAVEPFPVLASGTGKEAITRHHDHQLPLGHVHQVAPDGERLP